MDGTKDSRPRGNHPAPPLSLPSPPFSPGGLTEPPPGAPILFSAFLQCPAVSGMPETENLLSLASVRPRDLGLPLVYHPPIPPPWAGSIASHSQITTWASWKAWSSPPNQHHNSDGLQVFSHSLIPPHPLPHIGQLMVGCKQRLYHTFVLSCHAYPSFGVGFSFDFLFFQVY